MYLKNLIWGPFVALMTPKKPYKNNEFEFHELNFLETMFCVILVPLCQKTAKQDFYQKNYLANFHPARYSNFKQKLRSMDIFFTILVKPQLGITSGPNFSTLLTLKLPHFEVIRPENCKTRHYPKTHSSVSL